MPDKTVREMNVLEKKSHSLEVKTFHAVVFCSVILGIVLLVVGLSLYTISLIGNYVSHAYYLSQYAEMSTSHGADSPDFARRVMERYKSLSDEERALVGLQEYRDLFADFAESSEYDSLVHILPTFLKSEDVSNLYIAAFDEEESSLVYIVDSTENGFYPGEYEHITKREMARFLGWDGEGMLYYILYNQRLGWMCTAGTPLRDHDTGKLYGFLMADVTIGNILGDIKSYFLQITVSLVAAMVLMAWLMIWRMKNYLVKPIKEITEAAQGYVASRREGDVYKGIFADIDIHTGDEVEELGLVMADMERDLAEYEANLQKITAEKERISTELGLAKRIQADMLPNIYPAFPDRKEFDIYASMTPAKEVGGDFYDFFLVDDDHLCVFIADVSGKGVPAALFMMASMIILANNAKLGKSPAQILMSANSSICSNNREQMFVTVWLGILELSTGILTAANAGHEYPVVKTPDGIFELYKDRHGFVIGGMDGVKYREYQIMLEAGSKLFVYTDGVPEATDAEDKMFGTDRMLQVLNRELNASPEQIVQNVKEGVDDFVKDAEQFDDLTMLCLEYNGMEA